MVCKTGGNIPKRILFLLMLVSCVVFISVLSFAQEESEDGDNRQSIKVGQRLEKEREKPPEIIMKEGFEIEKPVLSLPAEKVLIKKINVIGATYLSEEEINDIILPYENKELTLEEMQNISSSITNAYRQKGYITSGAYIPLQTFQEGVLEIRIIEGRVGEIKIEGSRYFKSSLLKKWVGLRKGEPFNSDILKMNLFRINKHPDRKVRAVLNPGQQLGVTDIIVKVKDSLPMHILSVFDNYGHPNTLKRRYKSYFIHNNLTGRDDTFSTKIQMGEASTQVIYDIDYTIPVNQDLKLEFYALHKKEDYAKSRKDEDLEKKALKFIFLATRSLIVKPNYEFSVNAGFVYKDSIMYRLGEYLAKDRLRAIMLGLDLDMSDKLGRTIISNDMEIGIPGIMGGLENKDPRAFFLGAGGKYIKNRLIAARRHKLFSGLEFLIKSQVQVSSHVLAGVDNFAVGGIGGVVDNRGYPRSSLLGDSGFSTTLGFAFPPYFVPKDLRVPFSKAKLYNALKLFVFYDWGNTTIKSPEEGLGREKTRTLRSVGCGFRFNLPEKFSLRADFGWPLDFLPSDNDHFHAWVKVSKEF